MTVPVKVYLEYFRKKEYPFLFSEADLEKLRNVEKEYGDLETDETILEVCLSEEKTGCDYSICQKAESSYLSEYWYELDGENCGKKEIPACYFVDASAVTPGADNHEFYEKVLVKLAGRERVALLKEMLEICVAKLEGKCGHLFQLGSMNGRKEWDRIRLFTDDMTKEDILSYLTELGWNGNIKKLGELLQYLEAYSDKRKFILDFDILEHQISEKIGINFGTAQKKSGVIKNFLEELEKQGLCTEKKKEDVLRFIERFPSHDPFIQNDISHFKIPFQGGKVLAAKAYLRQGTVCYVPGFQAYDTPVLMNLELTTKCPLHCPQCYCELSGGKNMELETALHWIKEAAENQVKVVNLSGGETLLYPHLETLVKACSDYGMEANIAISGYGADKKTLEKLIRAGVSQICVSLNGSTEEINSCSRDGYDLARKALEELKKMQYANTYINWVMHSSNADDFENMIRLAERYEVSGIAVMVFKPDAEKQRKSVPTAEQIYKIAKCIKEYQGKVRIEAEECFSQLRAVLGKRFFTNLNRGIEKGCGAGRDGFSVSVDGRITPCRHLEIEEEFASLRAYWEQSQVLKELRNVEEKIEEPCQKCCYKNYCLPCVAVNWKMNGRLYMGDASCRLWQ